MAPSLEGYLSKKGKRIGSRVKRYMKLEGHVLSNHHSPDDPPTWQISVKEASISANPKKKKLSLELYNAKMELFCESKEECDRWLAAITSAKMAAHKTESGGASSENKENRGSTAQISPTGAYPANGQVSKNDPRTIADEDQTGKKKALDNLSKSFKVVKPPPRTSDPFTADYKPEAVEGKQPYKVVKVGRKSTQEMDETGSGDSDGDDEFPVDANVEEEEAHQPKNGKGRIYDDTPNSLIFKQFAFKT